MGDLSGIGRFIGKCLVCECGVININTGEINRWGTVLEDILRHFHYVCKPQIKVGRFFLFVFCCADLANKANKQAKQKEDDRAQRYRGRGNG